MKLKRILFDTQGTLGMIYDDSDMRLCYSLELPWNDNHPQTSCIPTGTYNVVDYESPTKGKVWLLENVPDRSMIEIHSANKPSQLLGCIAVGNAQGKMDGEIAVLNSVITLEMLHSRFTAPFTITIS